MKLWIIVAALLFGSTTTSFAAGGTDIVASKGQSVHVSDGWPKGAGDLANDPVRTTGWNDWFSEWPNDVNQYAMEAQSMEDVNRLIEKLAAVKSELKQVRLCAMQEPLGLGWVSSVPEGNKIPVMFSIGDQARMDQWYARVRKPFGVIEFDACPVAVPPTLTLFVQNPVIDLGKLKVPAGVTVMEGYLPTVFHQSNTKHEREQKEKPATTPPAKGEPLPPETQAAHDRIQAFLKQREDQGAEPATSKLPKEIGQPPVVSRAPPIDLLMWDRHAATFYTTGRFNGLGQWMFTIRGNTDQGELVGCELNQLIRMPHHANSLAVGGVPMSGGHPARIILGTNVGTVEVRDATTLQLSQTFTVDREGPKYSVRAVASDREGEQIAASGPEGSVLVWKFGDDQPVHQLPQAAREGDDVAVLAFSPEGQFLASLSRDGLLTLWDLAKGERVGTSIESAGGEQSTLQFTPSGDRLIVLDRGTMRFWHPLHEAAPRVVVPPEAVAPRYPPDKGDSLPDGGSRPDYGNNIRFAGVMALSPDAKRVASVTENGGLAIWEIATLQILATFPPPAFAKTWEHPGFEMERIAFSSDGKYVAATARSGDLAVWQVE